MKVNKRNDAEHERLLESMEDRVRSTGRLLDDIFDISRLVHKRFILRKEAVRARDILRRSIDATGAYLAKNKHRFTLSLPDKNVLIEADPVRIEQVVTNLLFNAAKYTPPGGMIVLKSTYENDPLAPNEGGQLVIRVRDTGVGLTEEESAKIFEPFIQVKPRHSLIGGIGLGLTLAKNLVEIHGGTIEVQSGGPGRGSEFIVRLPARIGTLPVKKTPAGSRTGSAKKILIVDDNVDAARSMRKLLELHGHHAEVAHSGQEALEKASAHTPSDIILDIGLPDIDGFEVARRLRAGQNSSVLIALSGYGQDEHRKKAHDAGFDYYLTKPVSIADIVKIVDGAPAHKSKIP